MLVIKFKFLRIFLSKMTYIPLIIKLLKQQITKCDESIYLNEYNKFDIFYLLLNPAHHYLLC